MAAMTASEAQSPGVAVSYRGNLGPLDVPEKGPE